MPTAWLVVVYAEGGAPDRFAAFSTEANMRAWIGSLTAGFSVFGPAIIDHPDGNGALN